MIKRFSQFIKESVDYENILDRLLPEVLKECGEYLKDLDLEVYFDDEYEFDDDNTVAIYETGSVIEGEIMIGINRDVFVQALMEIDADDEDAEFQVSTSIWHEVGHGLVEYMFEQWNTYQESGDENPMVDEWHKKYEYDIDNDDNEEDIVEEFGEYMSDRSYRNSSRLSDMIEDYKKIEW